MPGSRLKPSTGWLEGRLLVPSIIAVTAVSLVMAVVAPVDGDDACFHLRWITEFYDLLRQGVLIPRWLPNGFHGFGAPTFYFYPPLTYYFSSLVMWASGGAVPEVVFNTTALLSTLASAGTCYLLLRKLNTSKSMALLGGLFYAFAPYRQFDLYTRSSLSQPMGFVFVPLVFAGMIDVVRGAAGKTGKYIPNLQITISWAALLLCAFPIAVNTAIMLTLLWLIYRRQVQRSHVLVMIGSIGLGTLLVAYHYIPSIVFRPYVQTIWYTRVSDGNWIPALLHGTQLRFIVQDVLMLSTEIVLLVWWWRQRRTMSKEVHAIGYTVLFFAVISVPYLSAPIWKYTPLFHLIQFHSRFGILVLLLLTVLAFSPVFVQWQPIARKVATSLSVIATLLAVSVIFQINLHPHGTSDWTDPATFLPQATVSAPEAMERVFIPHLHDAEFIGVPAFGAGEHVEVASRTATKTTWRVEATTPHQLVLHRFAWPQWECQVDGRRVQLGMDSIGRVMIPLKAGSHIATLELVTSPSERLGNVISMAALISIALVQIITMISRLRKTTA